MERFEEILSLISVWSVILPLIIGTIFFPRLKNRSKIVWLITLFAAFPQMANFFLPSIQNIFYNSYTVLEFSLTLFFFYSLLHGKKERTFLRISVLLFTIYYTFLIASFGIARRFINEIVCLDNFFYTLFVLLIIYKEFDEETTVFKLEQADFYFLIGLLFYAPITVFIFSTWHYIHSSRSAFAITAKVVNDISNTSLYLFFSAGIMVTCYPDILKKLSRKLH